MSGKFIVPQRMHRLQVSAFLRARADREPQAWSGVRLPGAVGGG